MTTRVRRRWVRDRLLTRDTARGLPIGLWLGFFVAASCILVALIVSGPVVTASIEGSTETLELQTTTADLHWSLPGFRITECGQTVPVPMDGSSLVIKGGARIRFDRPEGGASVRIDISRLGSTAATTDCETALPVDLVASDGSVRRLRGAHVRLTRSDAATGAPSTSPSVAVLPFQARAYVGENLGEGVDRMLLKGTVTIHADQSVASLSRLFGFLHRKRTYTGESVALARGDRVLPPGAEEEGEIAASPANESRHGVPPTSSDDIANGYLRLVANDAIQFAFIERTNRVVIQRAGNARVEVELSFWQRLENEPALTGVIAFLIALVALVDLGSRFIEFFDWYGRSRSGSEDRRP